MPATQLQHSRKLNGNSRLASVYCAVAALGPREEPIMLGHLARLLGIAGLLGAMLFEAALVPAAASDSYDPWPGLVQDIFNNRDMNDGSGVIAIEMPYRAEDAAI